MAAPCACSRSGDVRTGALAPAPPPSAASAASTAATAQGVSSNNPPSTDSSDPSEPSFHTDFSLPEPGYPWNVFGARAGNRVLYGGADGLWIKIASGEKAWDAVGMRTAKIEIDGDFDLRAGYRDFSARGNGSAKLLVVAAKSRGGEAAYVERIRIDGKELIKFGGEVEGSLENWGFVASDLSSGELRLVRHDGHVYGYARPNENEVWTEIAPAQAVPRSMPRLLKFGVKLSSEMQKSAQVRWAWLTMRGAQVRVE